MNEIRVERRPMGGPGGPGGGGGMRGGRGLGGLIEKPKDFKGTWVKLLDYSKNYIPYILLSIVLASLGTLMQIIGPNQLKQITNLILKGLPALVDGVAVVESIDMNAIGRIAGMLAFFYISGLLLNYSQSFMMATITQKISNNLRTGLTKKINKLPLKFYDKVSYGDILSRMTNDVDTIGMTMNMSIGNLVHAVAMLVGSAVMMVYNNWIMALTAVCSSFLGLIVMRIMILRSQKHFSRQQRELGLANGHIEEIYTGHLVVKACNGGREAIEVFDEVNNRLYDSAWRSQFISGMTMPIMQFIGNIGYVSVCVVGATLVMRGSIQFGVIVAFMMYVRFFTQPLAQIAQAFQNLQRTAAAAERVFEFFEEEEMEDESKKARQFDDIKGDIAFRNVKFGYTPEQSIIHHFSADIKAGQKIAIVGPTGAGKTTIVNLLMRFYELDGGDILLDGVPLSQTPRENVHDQFSMVLQDTWLFEGTIMENIAYCKPGVTEEQVEAACRAVGLHHFIRALPKGYQTLLNDSTNLSQGQKQLITIARAMIQDSPMLILDEATSSVDTRTEHLIQQAMDKLTVGRTSFVIAHRLSTIKNADLILVMNEGDIVESGSHLELLAKGGFYAELYNSQFESAA